MITETIKMKAYKLEIQHAILPQKMNFTDQRIVAKRKDGKFLKFTMIHLILTNIMVPKWKSKQYKIASPGEYEERYFLFLFSSVVVKPILSNLVAVHPYNRSNQFILNCYKQFAWGDKGDNHLSFVNLSIKFELKFEDISAIFLYILLKLSPSVNFHLFYCYISAVPLIFVQIKLNFKRITFQQENERIF